MVFMPDKIITFEENVAEYDVWFEKNRETFLTELEAIKCFVPSIGKGVEIGVGTGRFAASLGITIGVEPSPGMAALARQRGVEVMGGVAEALPFADGTFDFILMVTVDCFLDDVTQAFREANRVLKSEGYLIIGFIDRESELGREYTRKKDESRFYRKATLHTVAELEKHLAQAGFAGFVHRQTLFHGQTGIQKVEEGYGKGSFVVVRATKTKGIRENKGGLG